MRVFWRHNRPSREAIRRHEARRQRAEALGGPHVEDFVFGANDGIITTFAIVAGATGGALGTIVILILGFANLLADGVSMGASNYLAKRSRNDYIDSQREMEEWEVDHMPEQEKDEVRRIFQEKGIEGEQLDAVVEAITQNRPAWIDIMMTHELGLVDGGSPPIKHGLATFGAFVVAGFVPLVPYLFCSGESCFVFSAAAAGVTLFATGALRTLITGINWARGGLEMLGVGSIAAGVAYGVGRLIAGGT